MARAFVIFTEVVRDPEAMGAYAEAASPLLHAFGGSVLVADSDPQVLEGSWHGTQTVVLAFPDMASARAWYSSDDYRAAMTLRQAAAECNVAILQEFPA